MKRLGFDKGWSNRKDLRNLNASNKPNRFFSVRF